MSFLGVYCNIIVKFVTLKFAYIYYLIINNLEL